MKCTLFDEENSFDEICQISGCSNVVDLVFAIDKSGSVQHERFPIVIEFIKKVSTFSHVLYLRHVIKWRIVLLLNNVTYSMRMRLLLKLVERVKTDLSNEHTVISILIIISFAFYSVAKSIRITPQLTSAKCDAHVSSSSSYYSIK